MTVSSTPLAAFRLDASETIGSGHMMRCLTLAGALRGEGWQCMFLMRSCAMAGIVLDAGHRVLELPVEPLAESEDAGACSKLLLAAALPRLDWLIVDHYELGSDWQLLMRPVCAKIAVIDDLADRPCAADLIVNQNLDPPAHARYASLVPSSCELLLGTRYALLRQEFSASPARERASGLRHALVSFGGTDPLNATSQALDALASTPGISADIVIGRHHIARDAILDRCAGQPAWKVHVQTGRVAELMDRADICLGAGGSSIWERCARGLPSLVLTVAENQRPLAEAAAIAGAVLWLGDLAQDSADQLSAHLQLMRTQPLLLRAMSRVAAGLCDGRGAVRVTSALCASHIQLRAATLADESMMLEWRNHPQVRRHSGNGLVIAPETHGKWLRQVIGDADRQLLVAELQGAPLAIVRFDHLAGGEPEISIYLRPERLGQGWGAPVLRAAEHWLKKMGKHMTALRARIHGNNVASQRAFAESGYSRQMQEWVRWL